MISLGKTFERLMKFIRFFVNRASGHVSPVAPVIRLKSQSPVGPLVCVCVLCSIVLCQVVTVTPRDTHNRLITESCWIWIAFPGQLASRQGGVCISNQWRDLPM